MSHKESEAAIGVLFDADRQSVLLIKRRDVPIWVLPGGGIDHQETPEEAIVREFWEETGLRVEIRHKIAEYTPLNKLAKPTHLFECQPRDGVIRLSCESTSIGYWPLQSVSAEVFLVHREWIKDAQHFSGTLIQKPIASVTYGKLLAYFIRHPIQVMKFASTRLRLGLRC